MIYICRNCGATFETPKTIYEYRPYGDSGAYEEFEVCPECKDDDFEEVKFIDDPV